MATLRDIRDRIKGVKNIIKITSAMKLVAAAKMRRAQDAILAARPYAQKLSDMLTFLSANVEDAVDPLLQERKKVHKIALLVITADRGLCGGFNNNLIRFANTHAKTVLKEKYPQAEIQYIPVGRRSADFYAARDEYSVEEMFPGIFTNLEFLTAQEISRLVTDGFLTERFDMVQLVFNEFKSTVKQEPVVQDFLPISSNSAEEVQEIAGSTADYIVEPSLSGVLSSLLPKHLNMQVWRALLESNAAEHAARMLAMENATNNARDLSSELELTYNKARQAAITTEILEVVGGAEALRRQ